MLRGPLRPLRLVAKPARPLGLRSSLATRRACVFLAAPPAPCPSAFFSACPGENLRSNGSSRRPLRTERLLVCDGVPNSGKPAPGNGGTRLCGRTPRASLSESLRHALCQLRSALLCCPCGVRTRAQPAKPWHKSRDMWDVPSFGWMIRPRGRQSTDVLAAWHGCRIPRRSSPFCCCGF